MSKVLTGVVIIGAAVLGFFVGRAIDDSDGAGFEVTPASEVAWMPRVGSYVEVAEAYNQLKERVLQANMEVAKDPPPFVLYYDDPENTPPDDQHYRICIPVIAGVASGDLGEGAFLSHFPQATAVLLDHSGDYSGIWPVIKQARDSAVKLGASEPDLGPSVHFFLVGPSDVAPEEIRSRVGCFVGPLPFPPPDTTDWPLPGPTHVGPEK